MTTPQADEKSIKHLVILMMENRSFDHFLGALSLPPENRTDIDGLPTPLPILLDSTSRRAIPAGLLTKTAGYADPPHDWRDQHANWNQGKNDGFVDSFDKYFRNNPLAPGDKSLEVPVGYYDRTTLPVLYALADQFTVCDRWFCSLLSSTWPNRKYLNAGARDADNDSQIIPPWPGFGPKPFYNILEDARDPQTHERLTWKSYYSDLPFLAYWYQFAAYHAMHNFAKIDAFVDDCREDRLPTVSIIDPPYSLADDHPMHDIRLGQKFIRLVVDALTHSESWHSTALVLIYDENGGFYDHVPPPSGFDGQPAETGDDVPFGFRVPAVIISPYARKGGCRTVFDHTSVMKSIAARWAVDFNSPPGQDRWTRSPDIWSHCFDFTQAPRPMGLYTHAAGTPAPYADLPWSAGLGDTLGKPLGDLEALLEKIFILPGLRDLDGRAGALDTLTSFEQSVRELKAML